MIGHREVTLPIIKMTYDNIFFIHMSHVRRQEYQLKKNVIFNFLDILADLYIEERNLWVRLTSLVPDAGVCLCPTSSLASLRSFSLAFYVHTVTPAAWSCIAKGLLTIL